MELNLNEAAEAIGYSYRDSSLLYQALTHRSYANEHNVKDNERLEFLGDSVLSVIISEHIFKKMAERTEGDLSKIRAVTVCEQSLAEAAKRLGLNKYILLGKGEDKTGGRQRPSIISDAFEAVIASIYLDGGIEEARKWVLSHLSFKIDDVLAGNGYKDYKTMLQERVQKGNTGHVTYETVSEDGEEHNKRFNVIVLIDGVKKADGCGKSKKEAEQEAAKHALERIKG